MGIDTRLSYGLDKCYHASSSQQYPVSPVSLPDTSSQPLTSSQSSSSEDQTASQCQPSCGFVVPVEQRQNPRRSSSQTQKPPTLVRQDERKVSFVDSLVDSATQMVEVIWPLSVAPPSCRPNASGVLSLRRYIEETLRRSRTSYSTLQVALYYLVLIMPMVPKGDFTREQLSDSPSMRSLQCGRRMFLAALILASKYLQDRNYSAKAWSKMSGLKVAEINMNERAFLSCVDWKLHIPDNIFKRWTDVVLRFTPSQSTAQQASFAAPRRTWKEMIPLLTPELDMIPSVAVSSVVASPEPVPVQTSFTGLPSYLEPTPAVVPPTPSFVRNTAALPTPRPTPSPRSYTPAVSVAAVESWPAASVRRSSTPLSDLSRESSPESSFSDASRLSRSSSFSSVSTSLTSISSQASVSAQELLSSLVAGRNLQPGQTVVLDRGLTASPVSVTYDEVKSFMTQCPGTIRDRRCAQNMPSIAENDSSQPSQRLHSSVRQMLGAPSQAMTASRKRSYCGEGEAEAMPRKQRCLSSMMAH
ncbi:hypothetical protein AAFC00_003662 [Neodothiora populina]|uniref:G1/S-specific cyclin pas1 n=1 Tax=Neodothiora populina TaxID=2781224 RepID=A0ABR3PFC8_9PEZI